MDRRARRDAPSACFQRFVSYLLAVLLVLQVASPLHHGTRTAAAPDEKTIALASLGAAVGRPATLCEHAGDPSRPDDPAHAGSCEHCIFCHAVAAGLVVPPAAIGVLRLATLAGMERPRESVAFNRPRHRGGATPRGPPTIG